MLAWLIDQNPKDYQAVRKDIAAVKADWAAFDYSCLGVAEIAAVVVPESAVGSEGDRGALGHQHSYSPS